MFPTLKLFLLMISSLSLFYLEMSDHVDMCYLGSASFIDYLSKPMLLMTIWVFVSMSLGMKSKKIYLTLVLMTVSTAIFFMTSSWIVFFSMFEFSLVPIFFLIISESKQPERLSAGYMLFLYTIFASAPLFVKICNLPMDSIPLSLLQMVEKEYTVVTMIGFTLAFLIKLPLFGVHLWLLKAHVEATMVGSMYLAGILLKFGAYGIIRVVHMTYWFDIVSVFTICMSVGGVGALYSALSSALETDEKLKVAFMSVCHMNLSLCCLLFLSEWSLNGYIMYMLCHSLISSALFSWVSISYDHSGSRSTMINKGMISSASITGLGMLVLALNASVPPSMGFMSEFMLLTPMSMVFFFFMLLNMMTILMNSISSVIMYLSSSEIPQSGKSEMEVKLTSYLRLSWLILPNFPLLFMSELLF
uniref:NADH-ubiquinone oxidoreductase chain 4 n=1 Tax=Microthoracius praelongiceps TaxID=1958934 RepID=A0A1S5XVS6_9NEOP|nr:NADH dehydrogenase subunit 4 [Microthoracius praelongiceps]